MRAAWSDTAAVVLGVLVVAAAAWLARGGILNGLNADSLYPLVFVTDLFENDGRFDWFVTPANGFFPDILIVMAGYAIGAVAEQNFVFFNIAYYALLFLSGVYFLAAAEARVWLCALVSLTAVLTVAFVSDHFTTFNFSVESPAHHSGMAPVALVGMGLALRAIGAPDRRWPAPALGLLLLPATFSDTLAVVQLAAPVIAVACVRLIRSQTRAERWALARLALFAALGGAVGMAAQNLFELLPHIDRGAPWIPLDRMWDSIVTFVTAIPELAGAHIGYAHFAATVVGLAIGLWTLPRLFRREVSPWTIGVSLLTASALLAIWAPVVLGTWTNPNVIRQQSTGFMLPVFVLVWGGYGFLVRRWGAIPVSAIATGIAGLAVALQLVQASDSRAEGSSLDFHREMAKAISEHDPGLVFVHYWEAKPLWYVARTPVCSVNEFIAKFAWITNIGWCLDAYDAWHAAQTPFVVGGRYISEEIVKINFGEPDARFFVDWIPFYVYEWTETLDGKVLKIICDNYQEQQPIDLPGACEAGS